MEVISISLSESLMEYVAEQVSDGNYSSASEYVVALIRTDQIQKTKTALEVELLKGLDSGPMVPVTPEDWANLRARIKSNFISE